MVKVPKIAALVALGLFSLALPALAAADSSFERRIIVFKPESAPEARLAAVQAAGWNVVRELKLIDAVAVEVPTSRVLTAEMKLRSSPHVMRVDEDPKINWLESVQTIHDIALPDIKTFLKVDRAAFADAPGQPSQPTNPSGQQVPWGIERVKASGAWGVTKGAGVKVCVIDTGIDSKHPDLKVAGGWNAITKKDDFMDDHGHGTHCSGTIAALDNDLAVVGVAPSVELYGVKVLDANGSGTFDDVIAGMEWCANNKMQIASMSLGASKGNDSLKAAVEKMSKMGTTIIAAAGNSGRAVGYPAAYPQAIAIAASDNKDAVAWFSSRGPEVAVIAPGVDVISLAPGGATASMSGTSMATPHVAGLAALAVAAKGYTGPEAIRAALKAAAEKLPNAPVEQQGAGLPLAPKLVK
jgi:subtilisin family serine protease